jgi:hypothetical protein
MGRSKADSDQTAFNIAIYEYTSLVRSRGCSAKLALLSGSAVLQWEPGNPGRGASHSHRSLVATAAENRLNVSRNPHTSFARPAIAEQSRFMSTRPSQPDGPPCL